MNEVRVIILGWGKVGKTTLRKRLIGEGVSENETQTDGIDIDIWYPKELPDVAMRIWDFGGQEIQHSVHNLFLQDNCVYLLVIDKRKDQQRNDDLVYWLEHIRSFGSNSPILIVENSIDTVSGIDIFCTSEQINELIYLDSEVRESFPDSTIDYVGVSALKGINIDTLKEKLYDLVARQNNKGQYTLDWLNAKFEVEKSITQGFEAGGLSKQNYITKEIFDFECSRHNVTDTDAQDTLLGVMKQLGIVSYYKKSNDKSNWLILNPEWLTTGIYSVLLHPKLKQLNGLLTREDVISILAKPTDSDSFFSKKHYTYNEKEMGYILDLMLDFELCFSPDNQEFFFPLGFKDNYQSRFQQENPSSISFFIDYETLPKAIWYKLMVRLFKRKLIDRYWGSGVELKYNNSKALIQINTVRYRRIQIWFDENRDIDLLTLVRYELDFVHEEFKSIPIVPKIFTSKGDEIDYKDLLALYLDSKSEYKKSFGRIYPVPETLQKYESLELTVRNIVKEVVKSPENVDANIIINELQKKLPPSVNIFNININQNKNIIENRLELPQQVNSLEGSLNFLIEELKEKDLLKKQLEEILKKINELRIIPTKEEAKKKGFFERFKKFADYFKTGSDLAKSIEELKDYVDVEKMKEAIELILQNIQ